MEIISYSENANFRTSKSPRVQLKPSLLRSAKNIKQAQAVAVELESQQYSLRGELQVALAGIQRFFRDAKKYAWIIPLAVIAVMVPFTVTKVITYVESYAKVVPFDADDSDEMDFLGNALSSFALNNAGSYDSDGTVLSADGSASAAAAVSFKQPVTFQTYKVRSGDTIDGISRKFGLSNISTLIAVNDIKNVRSLSAGEKLRIPSMDGIVHTVAKGETLHGLSAKFKVSVEDLLDVNDLSSDALSIGSDMFIPGARLDSNSLQRAMGETFSCPLLAKWRLTDKYGPRIYPFTGQKSFHTGIDMACPTGTPIRAAMSGTVAYTGVSNVYGNYVIVNHYDGYQTLYAHMSKVLAKKGQKVNQGDRIGLVGSTGQSTGPHLHFSVYKNGKLIDPLTVLK